MKRMLKTELRRMATLGAILALAFHASSLRAFDLAWTNNLLSVRGEPAGQMEIWYLEAFCRSNATGRAWDKTKIPHRTKLLRADRRSLDFETLIETNVLLRHSVRSLNDGIQFDYTFTNLTASGFDLEWFQPACIRVAQFCGADQTGYTARSFIFTKAGLTRLSETGRREEALYRGGQVYVPSAIDHRNVNPRPIAGGVPVNGLIGCFSADDKWLMATASSSTHELFEGVYVCLHSDPHVGGLRAHESKSFESKIYFLRNDIPALLRRYEKDFPRGL